MANVLDLRRRIRSVKNTRQITKAMKMVSAAKLRRAQERALAGRPYAKMMESVLISLKNRIEIYDPITGECRHPLLLTRPEKRVLLIMISGDKGFAGGFNANVMKAATHFLNAVKGFEVDVEAIGRKGRDLFRRRYGVATYIEQPDTEDGKHVRPVRNRVNPIEVTGDHPGMLDKLNYERVNALGREIVARYIHEEIDAAYIVYNEFKSVIQQRLVVERILPIIEIGQQQIAEAQELEKEQLERVAEAAKRAGVSLEPPDTTELDREAQKFGTADVDYIYEQPAHELYRGLLPRYVSTVLYHAMQESVAAEQAARMTAMDSATTNASEIMDSLTLVMNRVRQAAITKEIIEIVSGATAK